MHIQTSASLQIRAKTYIDNLMAVDSIVTVYYQHLQGGTKAGDCHNFWEFQYVDRGAYHVVLDGIRYDLSEGQMLLFAPNAYHCGTGDAFNAYVGIVSFASSSPIL